MQQTPPTPPAPPEKPREMGVEDLELKIDDLEKDIFKIDDYVLKLRVDKTNLSNRLAMFKDNIRYMRRHEGTVVLGHYRKVRIEIRKVLEQLRNNSNDVDKFEKSKQNTIKQIALLRTDLERKLEIEEDKILQFPRRISNVEQD